MGHEPKRVRSRSDRSDGPYRGGEGSAPAAEAHENGLVDELIQQFADPLAFYRELVQNSIDADATGIAITLSWDRDAQATDDDDPTGLARIRVSDDGCGMSRDVLENQLTVLFRSGKEGQADKIGKFGVGFVSVLALDPERVVVRTSEGQGELWTLVLKGDQTYELFRAQGGGNPGTSVTLDVRRRRSELAELRDGSIRALVRWCRHANLPIRFVATLPDEPIQEARIDRPLGLDALAEVRVSRGSTTVVAGVAEAGAYLGFFNQGLLLHETSNDLFGRVRIKVQDANLEHTLSRDNVRRDAHYDHAMRVVRHAVERVLTARVRDLLEELAHGRTASPPFDALLHAAQLAELIVDEDAVPLRLVEPLKGQRVERAEALADGPVYVARGSSKMTRALARRGVPVIDLGVARSEERYAVTLRRLLRRALTGPEADVTLAVPVELTSVDARLLADVVQTLGGCARRPSRVVLAALEGRMRDALFVPGELTDAPLALTEDEVNADCLRLLMRPPMILNANHPLTSEARRAAREHPSLAASTLARGVLLVAGRLGDDEDDAWLEQAVTGLGR